MSDTDALDAFLEQRDVLPKRCPSWCIGSHAQALEEGCTLEEASVHAAPDLCTRAPGRGDVAVFLRAEHNTSAGHWRSPLVEVFVSDEAFKNRAAVELTTGEARVLARQLLHLADLADLE